MWHLRKTGAKKRGEADRGGGGGKRIEKGRRKLVNSARIRLKIAKKNRGFVQGKQKNREMFVPVVN